MKSQTRTKNAAARWTESHTHWAAFTGNNKPATWARAACSFEGRRAFTDWPIRERRPAAASNGTGVLRVCRRCRSVLRTGDRRRELTTTVAAASSATGDPLVFHGRIAGPSPHSAHGVHGSSRAFGAQMLNKWKWERVDGATRGWLPGAGAARVPPTGRRTVWGRRPT